MSTTRLMLRWTAATKPGDYPINPIAQIVPKMGWELDNGQYLITPDCMTPRELDEAIDALVADLEAIREEGHRKFKEASLRAYGA